MVVSLNRGIVDFFAVAGIFHRIQILFSFVNIVFSIEPKFASFLNDTIFYDSQHVQVPIRLSLYSKWFDMKLAKSEYFFFIAYRMKNIKKTTKLLKTVELLYIEWKIIIFKENLLLLLSNAE